MRPQHLLFTMLLIGALFISGCGNLPFLSQGAAQPTPSPGASSGSAATPAPQPSPAAGQPTQAPANNPGQAIPAIPLPTAAQPTPGGAATPVAGGGAVTIPLPQIQTTPAQLESYRITIVMSTNGTTADGQVVESQTTYAQATHRPSKTGYTLVVEDRRGTPSSRSEIYSVGDMLYTYERRDGKEVCEPVMMAGMGEMLRGIADGMTAPVQMGVAQLVSRGETVNGVLTDRYTLDQETISQFGAAGATVEKADLWVARDGGYLVRYDLTLKITSSTSPWSGGPGIAAPMAEGTIAYNWSLEDINKATITLPSACGGQTVGIDLPLPPGAQVSTALPGATMGGVKASIDSVVTFFKTEYPRLGYELTYEFGDAQNGYILEFKKGSEEVMINISPGSDGEVSFSVTRS